MLGEELNSAEVTERGLVGDRQFAVVDRETGKIAGAKNPRKWGNFFDFRAAYTEPPRAGSELPEVRLTLPDGSHATSEQPDLEQRLSHALGREVAFARAQSDRGRQGRGVLARHGRSRLPRHGHGLRLAGRHVLRSRRGHLLTTGTIDRLRELYPEGRFEARRFRPNIVVSTAERGFVENEWIGQTVAIGDEVRLEITGPCGRCVMTTLSQGDLPKDPGILRTAAQNNNAKVGVYAGVVAGGTIRRGDPVTVAS